MMKQQEIVLSISTCDERRRMKAMAATAKSGGVMSVAMGRERNQLVVSGVGVDSVELTRSLRKILGHADIVSVRNVTSSTQEACFRNNDSVYQNYPPQPYYYHGPSCNYVPVPVYDSDPPPFCSIM